MAVDEAPKKFVRTLTTEVFKNGPADWCEESYLIPHEPIRWDLREATRLLQPPHFDGTIAWKVENFFNWYDNFHFKIHHHHDTEETIFFPVLSAKCSIPTRMASDHKGLLQMMDDIKSSRAAFGKATDDTERQAAAGALRTLWKKFDTTMCEHLAEEERVLTPLIRQHMTVQENGALIQATLKTLGLSGNKKMLPWILRSTRLWKTAEELDTFMAILPAPIRFLNEHWWTYAYERDDWGLLHSLESDKQRETSVWDFILV